jgi:hypothetical protein
MPARMGSAVEGRTDFVFTGMTRTPWSRSQGSPAHFSTLNAAEAAAKASEDRSMIRSARRSRDPGAPTIVRVTHHPSRSAGSSVHDRARTERTPAAPPSSTAVHRPVAAPRTPVRRRLGSLWFWRAGPTLAPQLSGLYEAIVQRHRSSHIGASSLGLSRHQRRCQRRWNSLRHRTFRGNRA